MNYNAKKEHDKAIADFSKAIELDPKYAQAYYNRAYAYEAKGEKMLADKDRQKAKELEGQPK
jgi:Tfp pilus assembly protein PilF